MENRKAYIIKYKGYKLWLILNLIGTLITASLYFLLRFDVIKDSNSLIQNIFMLMICFIAWFVTSIVGMNESKNKMR